MDHFCYLFFVFVMPSGHCSLVVTCLERADLLARLYVKFYCVNLSLSHVMHWVRCGTLLYRFKIFAILLTL